MTDDLILVDARNRAVGRAGKMEVHRRGLRHRAFSIFLVDEAGRLLLQRRSRRKYHSAGLWANSCCGHPSPGERTHQAARRRLREELGASARLKFGFRTQYRTALPNGLIEHEIVHVYVGREPRKVMPNPQEVAATAHLSLAELRQDVARRPRRYAYWLRYYLKNHLPALARAIGTVR
jgi:isopentenyl-diphosphate delta-isomerase